MEGGERAVGSAKSEEATEVMLSASSCPHVQRDIKTSICNPEEGHAGVV